MYGSWTVRWLYPASSEPPPLERQLDLDWDARWQMPQYPTWTPPWGDQPQEPIPNPDVPFVQTTWTMLWSTWSCAALTTSVEVEEVPDQFFLETAKPMPEFPPWMPPDHPSYYNQDAEQPHPEVHEIRIPQWPDWRPQKHRDFFDAVTPEEFVTPDKYESPHRLPIHPIPQVVLPYKPQEEEPLPELDPYLDQEIILPVQPAYWMPPFQPYFNDLPSPPPKCPPPCLRRPDKKC